MGTQPCASGPCLLSDMQITFTNLLPLGLLLVSFVAQAAECGEVEWFVKPNGTQLTRPAYTIKDGALIKSASRAWVGTQCDTSKPTKPSNKDLYASYDSTDKLALCSKR